MEVLRLERLAERVDDAQVTHALKPVTVGFRGDDDDGYVGEVLAALRVRQEAGGDDAGLAAEALGLLAGMLADSRDSGRPA